MVLSVLLRLYAIACTCNFSFFVLVKGEPQLPYCAFDSYTKKFIPNKTLSRKHFRGFSIFTQQFATKAIGKFVYLFAKLT